MKINANLSKNKEILIIGTVIAIPVVCVVLYKKYAKKNEKKCNELREKILQKYSKDNLTNLTLGNKFLESTETSKVFKKVFNLRMVIENSFSLKSIKDADKKLEYVISILKSNDKHVVKSYAQYLLDLENDEKEAYRRKIEETKINNEHSEAIEKIYAGCKKVNDITNAASDIAKYVNSKDK